MLNNSFVLEETGTGLILKKYHKNKVLREKQLSNFKINTHSGNYVAITASELHRIIELNFPEELKLFRKVMKRIHKGLRFFGNDKDYQLLRNNIRSKIS